MPAVTALLAAALLAAQPQAAPPEEAPRVPGASIRLYQIGAHLNELPVLVPGQTPNVSQVVPEINFIPGTGFLGLEDRFYTEVTGWLRITEPGRYAFRLTSDDGSALFIDGVERIRMDQVQSFTPSVTQLDLTPGDHPFRIEHFENLGGCGLLFEWRPPGATGFTPVPAGVLMAPGDEVRVTSPGDKLVLGRISGRPGDKGPLAGVHPSFDLAQARPSAFQPRVGGIDFLSDGRLVLCTWDPEGAVYILDGVQGDDPEAIEVRKIAAGLAEPLGVKVVDDRIFVLQKQELTELIDHDGDGRTDEYRVLATGWPVSSNFHEFAFGLVERDRKFYFCSAIAIDPGGRSTQPQVPRRGTVMEVDLETGGFRYIAHGLRTPNGIGLGPNGQILVTDNQGDWVPVSKLVQVDEGDFFGSRAVEGEAVAHLPVDPPIVWLPQGEIGNSPSQPTFFPPGTPYAGQLLHGDVTHGGLKRTFVEVVDGVPQGAVFRFTQGLEAGVNRIAWGPGPGGAPALYIGGIGSTGNWGQEGKLRYGLQRLAFNGAPTFEMLAVRARQNGLEIEFTQPLAEGVGHRADEYDVTTYRYEPTAQYGGPKVDEHDLIVDSVSISDDRRRVFLEIEGLQPGYVVHLRVPAGLYADGVGSIWSTEAWYTMNRLPARRGEPGPRVVHTPHNALSAEERAEGWRLLFDGSSLDAWRGFKSDAPSPSWRVLEGQIVCTGLGGDLLTRDAFGDFELSLEWSVDPGGNSGIIYGVRELPETSFVWETGPEMQILDNTRHPDGRHPATSAGANYALYPPSDDVTRPVGAWNHARIVKRGDRVEHWLNGVKVVEYDWGSEEWARRVAGSKFASMPNYGKFKEGHIAIQDHGDRVAFRNIKIRSLD